MLTRVLSIATATLLLTLAAAQTQGPATTPAAGTVSCRALEAHSDDELKVTVVVFHQRNEEQRSQLGMLLREHSGEMVEVQAGDGNWQRARMVRLKSCFGRGLLLLPAPAPISERSEFMLRLPAAK